MSDRVGNVGGAGGFDAKSITRPHPLLQRYYLIVALLSIFGFPFVYIPLLIKYKTLKYTIDDEGVSMSWGFFFRREILLTYRRIQDIHVRRNIIQRWLGLASVAVQTASGTSGAEMTIEGILEPEKLRDFLYKKMRGAKARDGDGEGEGEGSRGDEALMLLREIRDGIAALGERRPLEGRGEA